MTEKAVDEAGVHCRNCDQTVKPVIHNGAGRFFGFLALCEFVAVVVAIVALFRPLTIDGGLLPHLVMWPAAIHPAWLGLLAALAALFVTSILSIGAGEQAKKAATCPKCKLRLTPDAE